ncbi:MAG TPA: Eco57I restriction-modification methylase domain-containing protein, partial [Spirochaetota bacterium]|nr:Eco57I restriction-modification methylase domain-containing protein [Spirochaetota bacterium]
KAGGVFYTPVFIVEYLVSHTLGKLLESMTLVDIIKRPIRALDMSCGSGSFLIVVYQYFLDWYLREYTKDNPAKYAKGKNATIVQVGYGWKLTTQERKRILLAHVFGVDIDSQAVEVTKLSLLLKVLEDETSDSINSQLSMFHERALPDLANNIKCGNSLIGPDIYKDTQLTMLTDDDQMRLNVFDWEKEFPFKFDVICGNPPYVRIQTLKEWSPIEVEHYKTAYKSAAKGNYDIYVTFVERGLELLADDGVLGFILPNKFFNAQYGEPLRGVISNGRHLTEIVHFGDQQVFSSASTYTCLMFLSKKAQPGFRFVQAHDLDAWRRVEPQPEGKIDADHVSETEWNFGVGKGAKLFDRLKDIPLKLEHVTSRIFQGIKTSADKIYIVEERERKKGRVLVYSPEKDVEFWLELDLLHPLVKGGDSKAYSLTQTERLILFPYAPQGDGATKLIPEDDFKSHYPLSWEYLKANKSYLENRENGKMRGSRWYGYVYPKALEVMPLPKIFTPDIAPRAAYSLDPTGEVFFTGGAAGGYGILVSSEYSREYVLGLLNSRLLDWLIKQTATQFRGGWYSFEARFIRNLPIRTIDFNDPTDKARHDKIVALVEQMLTLNKKLAATHLGHEKTAIQRQIDATDKQIDALVYELYGLTEEEIRIVEGE